jgi:predicted adenine nucleotide alpha hydrolase (AANH) superfamily ATPase
MSEPSFWQILENPELRKVEIERIKAAAEQSVKEGNYLDASAYRGSMQLFTDAEEGIERCYSCGKIKKRARTPPDSADADARKRS